MAERLSLVAPETSHAILTLISTTLDCTSRRFGLPEIGVKPPRDIPNHISEIAARYRESRFSDVVEYRIDIYSHFAALIGGLFDRPEKQRRCRDTVITFNYDLVLDRAFEQMGIDFGYGLNIDQSDASGPDVTFLKLHGSINWKTCPTCEGVKITSAIDSKNALSNCSDCGQRLSPLLVPPSWDKASSGIHGARQLASQWRAAAEALTSATRICIIGYSVPETDAFFRYLLTLGLAENPRLNILLVIDPSGQVGQKFDNLLDPIFVQRRFQFLQEPFEQALGKRELYQLLRRGNESIADINNYGTPIML